MPLNLGRLNPRQREAVLHGDGPLLILAGAGSGKTSTMAYRIAHLIAERRVSPTAILGLSFTNKAANELKERVTKLVHQAAGKSATRGLIITTFHSLCARVLRTHGERIGFGKNFTILDTADQRDVLREIFKNIRIDDRKFDHDYILGEFGRAKNRFLRPEAAQEYFLGNKQSPSDYGIAAATAYSHYQDKLKALNAMDFDDLQYHAVDLLENHMEVRHDYCRKIRYILVDEYQDTNPAQFRILNSLTTLYKNLCVVGDDDQSIYSWRGADAAHILQFTHHFPQAKTIVLDQNYRSTSQILEAANAVIKNNRVRHAKSLWSERGHGHPIFETILQEDRDEAEFVSEEILKLTKEQNRPFKDFAILYRSNAQSRIFEESLRRNKIPYKIVGGMSFLDRKEVKNALCYLRLIVNPKDDASLRRIMNWPARSIGKSSIEALSDLAFKNHISLFETLPLAKEIAPRAAVGAQQLYDRVAQLREQLEAIVLAPDTISDWARKTLEVLALKKAIEEDNEDPLQAARQWENVEELVHSLGQTKAEVENNSPILFVQEFLNQMTLQARDEEEDDKKEENSNQVTLLTLHGAKGLEFPVVFLVGLEEGFLPHKRTIEEATDLSEERRLAYVGITRAKDLLYATRAKTRVRYGKPVPRTPSRFLQEIPKEYLLLNDKSFPDETSSVEAREAHENRVKDHLAKIRAMLQ